MSHVSVPTSGAPSAARGVAHGGRAAAVDVGALFATNGLVIGGYVGVLPALRTRLGIEAATLTVLLGWLVHTAGVQRAMLLPFGLAFVLVVITRWMPAIHRSEPTHT